jgi:hypothetical protein
LEDADFIGLILGGVRGDDEYFSLLGKMDIGDADK